MAAALPHCDALVSGHSFDALDEVVDAIGVGGSGTGLSLSPSRRPRSRRGAVGERDPGPGQLGRDAERLRPEQGQDDARLGDRWKRVTAAKTCIYPGCERPGGAAASARRTAAGFCDLEEHNALTAHQERQRLERRRVHRNG